MRYYVYENYPTNTATTHEGSCRNCNEGKGKRGATDTVNGRWHGPFETIDAALKKMNETGRKHRRKCKICL
jgi:hypothetical protein